jgi:hypothetical protein
MTLVRSSLLGAGIGATSMFLLDPARGARRRAILRDKMTSASRRTVEAAGATFRDLSNRFEGVQSRTRNLFAADAVDNAALAERVKSALGRVTAHHRAISVLASDGWVTLYGDVLESERRSIISAVERIRGVAGVENNLRIHLFADNVPALQGGSPGRAQWTWLTDSWSPAAILAGGAAIAVAAAALLRVRTDRLTAAAINEW